MSKSFGLDVMATVVTNRIVASTSDLRSFYRYMIGDNAKPSELDAERVRIRQHVLRKYPKLASIKVDRPLNDRKDCKEFINSLIRAGYSRSYKFDPLG